MSRWVKKFHMYAGLLNLSILLVFGISGLVATIEPRPEDRHRPEAAVELRDFQMPRNLSDHEAAAAAVEFLKLPLSDPPPRYAVRRDGAGNVAFTLYSFNGPRAVTLLEKENRIRVETRRNTIWHFIDNLHTTTVNNGGTDIRVRMWTWYNEFAIWSLIFMSITGVWLWLASRPRFRWAQISMAAGSGAFLLLYALTR